MQADLVRRAQEGDHEAFALLAERVIRKLRGTARLLLHDPTRADDAVQEALIAAWQHLPSLREPDRVDAWLNRLLVNACRRAARHDVTRRLREIPIGPDHDRPSAVADPLELRDQLERAFGRLSDEHRTLLALVYYADLSLADAAAAAGIPLGTAKSRMSRAMESLRAAIAADERAPTMAQGRTA